MKIIYTIKYYKNIFFVYLFISLIIFFLNPVRISEAEEILKSPGKIQNEEKQKREPAALLEKNISSYSTPEQFLKKPPINANGEDIKIIVYKSKKLMELYKNGRLSSSQNILLSPFWHEKKRMRGDKRTPEGEYYVCCKKDKSKYNYFIGISYPNDLDALYALKKDLISVKEFISINKAIKNREKPPWDTKLGGYIGIHGAGKDREFETKWKINWTNGCIAINDDALISVYNIVEIGTPLMILP